MAERTMIEVDYSPLAEADGKAYRSFEECFADYAAQYQPTATALIKRMWNKEVDAYYSNLVPPQNTRCVAIGAAAPVTAVPVDQEAAVMQRAMQRWRRRQFRTVREQLRAVNLGVPLDQQWILVAGTPAQIPLVSSSDDEE